jgi:hypothetical protein
MLDEPLDLRLREHFYDNQGWDQQCALERRFARIARELVRRWHQGDVDDYLDRLLIDDRGNRMGFPHEVLEELIFLASIRWHLNHDQANRWAQTTVPEFSFHAWDDTARTQDAGRAWVLE